MASTRAGFREHYHGVLILIISSQLGSVISTTWSPKTTKSADSLSKNVTTHTRQRKQNVSTLEMISQTSSTPTPLYSSIALETRNINASQTGGLGSHGCSGERKDKCPRFVDKYSSFYLKVGTKKY